MHAKIISENIIDKLDNEPTLDNHLLIKHV